MGFKEDNQNERLRFVDFWSRYVATHSDKDWSEQQNKIINSCLRNTIMTKELYLKIKQMPRSLK